MPQIRPKQLKLLTSGSLLVGGKNGTGSSLALGDEGQVLKVIDGNIAWSPAPSTNQIISPDTFNSAQAENSTGVVISVADSTTSPTKSIPLMTFSAGKTGDENLLLSSSANQLTLTAAGSADDVGITIASKGKGDVTLGNGTGEVILSSTGASLIQSEDGKDLIISGGDTSGNLFMTVGKDSISKVYYANDASDSGKEIATLNDIKSSLGSMTGRSQFTGDQSFLLPENTNIQSIIVAINGLIIDASNYSSTNNGTNVVVTFTSLDYTLDSDDEVIFTYNLGV